MTTDHTPGPWEIGPKDHFREGDIASDKGWLFQRLSAATDADSALVAAAPDLLATLEQVDAYLAPDRGDDDEWHEIRTIIQAAITKAKGV